MSETQQSLSAGQRAVALLCAVLAVGVVAFLNVYAGMRLADMHRATSAEYAPKTCTVLSTKMDSWQEHEYQVYLPKVQVTVIEDLRSGGGPVWAYRFREGHSNTMNCDYEGGAEAWLTGFSALLAAHGTDPRPTVPCYQDVNDPEVVKFEEGYNLSGRMWLLAILFSVLACLADVTACCVLALILPDADSKEQQPQGDSEELLSDMS